MADFTIKRKNTSPAIVANLISQGNVVPDLNGATVRFKMQRGDVLIDEEAEVLDEETALVRYQWQDGDTDVVGMYVAEWIVTYSNSYIESFPNTRRMRILINDSLV